MIPVHLPGRETRPRFRDAPSRGAMHHGHGGSYRGYERRATYNPEERACSPRRMPKYHPRAITRTYGIDWSSGVALECLKGPAEGRDAPAAPWEGRRYYSCYLSSRMYVGRQSGTLVQKCHPHAASIKDFYGSVACHRELYIRSLARSLRSRPVFVCGCICVCVYDCK